MTDRRGNGLRPAAFLDRDGVINADRDYVFRREDFVLLPGVLEAAARLHAAGFLLVVVTNQSGIGRGYYTEEDFQSLTDGMRRSFREAGAPLAGVYFCPHHPTDALPPYRRRCDCRKPLPGMILRAARDLGIDLPGSVLFGDGVRDMQAALAAGIPRRILLGRNAAAVPEPVSECTDTALGLPEGVGLLLSGPVRSPAAPEP